MGNASRDLSERIKPFQPFVDVVPTGAVQVHQPALACTS
jgi:hypothetical protein